MKILLKLFYYRDFDMNNIRNTMCRISDLTQEQIDSLVYAMPDTHYFSLCDFEGHIGFYGLNAGTWAIESRMKIITYTEMMQLLKGKDMNKQTAQEQMAVMQIEMDKLKAIIDKPEAKTGRVMSVSDLQLDTFFWSAWDTPRGITFRGDNTDKRLVEAGIAFHDKETAEKYIEYLKLEQELRRAQAPDGGAGINSILLTKKGSLHNETSDIYHEKISFKTREARDAFRTAHTDEQLTLLIRGV
jgi:hypothetical protein